MQTVSMSTMKGLIDHKVVRKRRTLFVHGKSGIGKSEGIFQSASEHNATMVDFRVSQYESIDLRGIPDIQAGTTVWNMPATIPFKGNAKFDEDSRPIFLFLDEVNQGDPSVLSVLYQLINDRRIGEHMLMDNVHMLCAGNLDSDRGTTNKFPAPLDNRMVHCQLEPDIKSCSAHWGKLQKSPVLIGFLNFRSELLHTFDPAKPVPAWASPRTWMSVEEDFVDETMPEDVKLASMSGSVGEGPITELMAFKAIMDSIVPIEQIIADPTGVHVSHELDLQWAMATHVASHMDKTNADQLHQFLTRLEAEMCVMAWTMAIQRDADITDSQAFLFGYAPQYRGLFNN